MTRFLPAFFAIAALAVPASAENPVSDHAELWDKARERTSSATGQAKSDDASAPRDTTSVVSDTKPDQQSESK
ncbi:MAG: hypothetical protein AAGD47_02655 [Pseudomonadota bacterium]